jgi:hypothetical protein
VLKLPIRESHLLVRSPLFAGIGEIIVGLTPKLLGVLAHIVPPATGDVVKTAVDGLIALAFLRGVAVKKLY